MITLFLAEDQSMLNSALSQLLDLEDNLKVVGTASDGQMAWEMIQKQSPDVAILDIEMPRLTGLAVAQRIHEEKLPTRVVILTTFARQTYFEQAVQAQVAAYLLKDSPSEELIGAINQVMTGKIIYDPALVQSVLSTEQSPLTKRETEVLKVAASGMPTKEIAQQLFLSEGTIRNYLSAIFSKLGVRNRLEAVELAQNNRWI
ncbi:response regulator transcription factor [Pediococcus acidilactici]|uniref:Response regulator receiver domain protein n=1 Tax=Pediococcus acidilactici DSM 20284 TaxID=862514 RepID=E0NGY8_PEDAC|nr:response regulator transcription factor [Pediococcus acidilactici]AZP91448.1 DNA-binding response regulator [Pediococcus acidilactici]EFL95448.1 response regulator receiver domain protein [Pediococcus acidilactici DSM 20284]KRN16595.1 DNA-binding response regulator [Pediococcus acidilactici]MDB8868659.1 response regulator transcription factor [Pediococcus acidilactici]MDG9738751.1 response regulator transcription factor [Pediococcus acidilactici]